MERSELYKDTASTLLLNLLTQSLANHNQVQANQIAVELAYRVYSPGKNFDDLLAGFGYSEIEEEEKQKIKHMGMS